MYADDRQALFPFLTTAHNFGNDDVHRKSRAAALSNSQIMYDWAHVQSCERLVAGSTVCVSSPVYSP